MINQRIKFEKILNKSIAICSNVGEKAIDAKDEIMKAFDDVTLSYDLCEIAPSAWECSYGKGLNTYVVDSLEKMDAGHYAIPLYKKRKCNTELTPKY